MSLNIYVALFRGINVGGRNALPMKELLLILEQLGARPVKTYIQSGNAVFAMQHNDTLSLSRKISGEIKKRRGFEPHVLLLTVKELEKAIRNNPFSNETGDPRALHAGFLAAIPKSPNLAALEALKTDTEKFKLVDRVFYLHAPDGIGRSKLAARAEKLLGVAMTDRNWNTVVKIRELANDINESS